MTITKYAEDYPRLRVHFMAEADRGEPDGPLIAALNAIGTDKEVPLLDGISSLIERELAEARAAYTARTREAGGRVWDLLPPGTPPCAGDEIEDEGVWRPRPVIADHRTRYDRAVFLRREAQRLYDADPSEETRKHLEDAWRRQHEALRASDDDTVRQRDQIDEWRAGEGRDLYNAGRRKFRDTPNANLSVMSDEEKAAHKREQARVRKQRSRAKATK